MSRLWLCAWCDLNQWDTESDARREQQGGGGGMQGRDSIPLWGSSHQAWTCRSMDPMFHSL